MDLLKKIGFFVVFFLTLTQVMGNSGSRFQEKFFDVENHEKQQPFSESISPDFNEFEDESFVNSLLPCICVSVITESIKLKEFHFPSAQGFAFWQPPRNS